MYNWEVLLMELKYLPIFAILAVGLIFSIGCIGTYEPTEEQIGLPMEDEIIEDDEITKEPTNDAYEDYYEIIEG